MSGSRFELPADRLSTTDESGARIYLKPDVSRGRFFRIRSWLQPLLILIFLGLPWIRVAGEPLILLDVPHRRFTLFGTTFWAHDVPMLFFIFAIFSLTVAFITAVWGRVWCGWACPQTVFIEGVFRKIERWVEGFERGNYRTSGFFPEGAEGWSRWIAKWLLFLAISLILAHAFIAYFVGTDHLLRMMARSPSEAPGWFLFMAIVTAIVLFDFGWFREQFCVIACPYGRIQSLFIDDQSKLVAYDYRRGEPRKGAETPGQKAGDCVNCFRCVQVCPTGIDIRRGNQLECVGCTACIDACDEVMEKVKRPQGLIRHVSMAGIEGRPARPFRPRILIYFGLVLSTVAAFTYALTNYRDLGVDVLRAAGLPFEILKTEKESTILNHFHAEVWNGRRESQIFQILLSDEDKAKGVELVLVATDIRVAPGEKRRVDFFVKSPPTTFREGRSFIHVDWKADTLQPQRLEIELVGPAQ